MATGDGAAQAQAVAGESNFIAPVIRDKAVLYWGTFYSLFFVCFIREIDRTASSSDYVRARDASSCLYRVALLKVSLGPLNFSRY